jgi:cysteine synthase
MEKHANSKRIRGIGGMIGRTPLLVIDYSYMGEKRKIYAKAEHLNFTGSIKDRMAFYILTKAYENGILKPGDHIVEATSGNTGIAFSGIGRAMGHPVTIFIPDWMSIERINLIQSFGAHIQKVSKAEGGFLGSIALAEKMAAEQSNVFLPRQFENADNCEAHYQATAFEIWTQMQALELSPQAFVAGVGTGGTVMGIGRFLKEKNSRIFVHPLEPMNSPTMSTGHKVGMHRIQGISDEFIPEIVKLDKLDKIVAVDDGDSIIMAQKLARSLGLGVGISSGANFLGAVKLQNEMGPNTIVVTVFSDDNKKYLSTDYSKTEPVKDGFLSTGIELNGFTAIKRTCNICCDPADCIEWTPGYAKNCSKARAFLADN